MIDTDEPKAFGLQQLTEREVLAAARAVRELQALRSIQNDPSAYTGVLKITAANVPLETDEVSAVLSLLIERHTVLLANLGIVPDAVPA